MTQLPTGAYAFFARRNLLKIPKTLENFAPMAWTEYSKPWSNANAIKIMKDGTLLEAVNLCDVTQETEMMYHKNCYVTFTSSLHLGRLKKNLEAKKSPCADEKFNKLKESDLTKQHGHIRF